MYFENIWADYFTGNPASGRVMQKCGFRNTGKLHRCNNLVGGDKDMVHIYKLEIQKEYFEDSACAEIGKVNYQ